MNEKSQIGAMIQHHRKKSGLSRKSLAELAGVGKTAIYDIEHGKVNFRINTLFGILNVLNIKIKFESPLIEESEGLENA
ncbi:MAG: helix-turn-helix domain-containing protein [Fidelibacterota bacterium]